MEPEFKNCVTCKKKIGYMRKRAARKQDKSGKYPILQSQFCSPKCAKIGYNIFMEVRDAKRNAFLQERQRALDIIDSALEMIEVKRGLAIRKYGYMENIPPKIQMTLYPGAFKLLQRVREKIEHGTAKKSN